MLQTSWFPLFQSGKKTVIILYIWVIIWNCGTVIGVITVSNVPSSAWPLFLWSLVIFSLIWYGIACLHRHIQQTSALKEPAACPCYPFPLSKGWDTAFILCSAILVGHLAFCYIADRTDQSLSLISVGSSLSLVPRAKHNFPSPLVSINWLRSFAPSFRPANLALSFYWFSVLLWRLTKEGRISVACRNPICWLMLQLYSLTPQCTVSGKAFFMVYLTESHFD